MMSAISVAANSHGQDAMLFITIGEKDKPVPETKSPDKPQTDLGTGTVEPESDRERRHGVDFAHTEFDEGASMF